METWKLYCSQIKVRTFRRFAKRRFCEEIQASLKQAISLRQDTTRLKELNLEHVEIVARERRFYKKKRDEAILDRSRYMSIVIDGADQSAYGLPHFCVHTKAEPGMAIKVRLVGFLQHSQPNRLLFMTMREEFESGQII